MEILSTEPITHEPWINLFARRFRHQGHEGRWVFASRRQQPTVPATGFDAVLIIPVLVGEGESRLVLLREYRVPLGDYNYAFPAGLAEPGETPEAVARRELKEETGLEVAEVRRVSPVVSSSAGLTDEAVVLVFVTARAVPGQGPTPDRSEDFEVAMLDFRQVCELCQSDARIDAKAWTILYMYQQLGALA
jgi:ADP-ribose pyrophosphatase